MAIISPIASGNFSDPAIWPNGQLPQSGDDIIYSGYDIVYDVNDPVTRFGRVMAEGSGSWTDTANIDTAILFDTFVFGPGTDLMVERTDPNFKADYIISAQGNFDPALPGVAAGTGRAFMGAGKAIMKGAAKTTIAAATIALAGATSVTVSDASGWQQGDAFAISGTKYHGWANNSFGDTGWNYYELQTEYREVASVSGNQINFTDPLEYDHRECIFDTPGASPEPFHVVNLTRNVRVRGEIRDAPVLQRGHVIFMRDPDAPKSAELEYVEFVDVGRTRKDQLVVQPADIVDPQNDNWIGKYSMHFHLTGVQPEDPMHCVVGCSIHRGVGVGHVWHGSKVNFERNVVMGFYGCGNAGENGNEVEIFIDNFVGDIKGTLQLVRNPGRPNPIKAVERYKIHDNMCVGAGYEAQNRFGYWFGNIAADCRIGYFWQHRDLEADHGQDVFNANGIDAPANTNWSTKNQPLRNHRNNTGYSMEHLLHVMRAGFPQERGMRSHLVGYTGWAITRYAIQIEYTHHYTLDKVKIKADYDENYGWSRLVSKRTNGVEFEKNTLHSVLSNSVIEGFDGILAPNGTQIGYSVYLANIYAGGNLSHAPIGNHWQHFIVNTLSDGAPIAPANVLNFNLHGGGEEPLGLGATLPPPNAPRNKDDPFNPPENFIIDGPVADTGVTAIDINPDSACWHTTIPTTPPSPHDWWYPQGNHPIVNSDFVTRAAQINGTSTDSLGQFIVPTGYNDMWRYRHRYMIGVVTQEGFWYDNGVPYTKVQAIQSDRLSGETWTKDVVVEIKEPIEDYYKELPQAPVIQPLMNIKDIMPVIQN